jgi:hypothetical protein
MAFHCAASLVVMVRKVVELTNRKGMIVLRAIATVHPFHQLVLVVLHPNHHRRQHQVRTLFLNRERYLPVRVRLVHLLLPLHLVSNCKRGFVDLRKSSRRLLLTCHLYIVHRTHTLLAFSQNQLPVHLQPRHQVRDCRRKS